MFTKSLDNKTEYTLDDGTALIDLTESIFDSNLSVTRVGQLFKIPKEYEMRPDLISMVLYGSTDYTEMIMKYSIIQNPFSVDKDDIIYQASINSIYDPIKETIASNKVFDAVKNYHKYIDKSKVPTSAGSQKNTTSVPDTPKEANISEKGDSGITISNGKIYFGDIDDKLKNVSTPLADCAKDGMSIGDFLNKATQNS